MGIWFKKENARRCKRGVGRRGFSGCCRTGGDSSRSGIRAHRWAHIMWTVGRDLIGLQSSLRLSLGLGLCCLRLRMCLGRRCSLVTGFGRHDGSVLHDLDIVLIPFIHRFVVRIVVIILVSVGFQWIHVHSTARHEIPAIDHQAATTSDTSPK